MAETKKAEKEYVVQWRLEGHNGKTFNEGDKIKGTEEELDDLIKCGVLKPVGKAKAEAEQGDEK